MPFYPAFYFYKAFCNTTEFASGQDRANPLFWLTTRAGKMGISCPLVISHGCLVRKNSLLTMK